MPTMNKKNKSTLQLFGQVSGLGISFVLIVCFVTYVGYSLDKFLTTSPIFSCIGLVIGFFIAFVSIYQIIKKDNL